VTPWVQRLIILNVLIFFLQMTTPEVTTLLEFVPVEMLTRPWTIVTYMFLHGSFMHIFWNMLGFFFFAPRVEQRMGSQRFITLYLISGISGALLSFLLAPSNPIIGASGAVLGVMMAYARFWPRDRFLIMGVIPIEARWLVLIYAAWDLLSARGGFETGVANFAHLGGFAGALLYVLYLEQRQGAKQFARKTVPSVADPALGNWQKVDTSSIHAVNRDEVNRILDKISASGMGSLTPQERQFLSNFVPPDDRKTS